MKELIAKDLLKIKAVFFRPDEPFTWASGIKSPVYCDNRLILTAPEVRRDVENGLAAIIKEQYPEVEDLCIFATGFGAYMALLCLEELLELPGKVKLVVQTPSVLMHETLLSMKNISRPTFQAMGEISFTRRRPLTVKYSFYEDLVENTALITHPIPMLILHGEYDDYIPMEHILHLRRLNEDAKLVIIPGASHRFLEEGAWDMVLDLTRDWFEFEQVLVTDWE